MEGWSSPHVSSRSPQRHNARPTMRDVAERAGVAVVTVSRVVNGIGTVREETVERVTAAINAIGYQRNEIARSLRPGQNSMTIGLLLGDLTNPFYASLAKAAVEVAGRAGHAGLPPTAGEGPAGARPAARGLIGRRVARRPLVPHPRGPPPPTPQPS